MLFYPKPVWSLSSFIKKFNAKKVNQGFNYNSGNNSVFLSVFELKN